MSIHSNDTTPHLKYMLLGLANDTSLTTLQHEQTHSLNILRQAGDHIDDF